MGFIDILLWRSISPEMKHIWNNGKNLLRKDELKREELVEYLTTLFDHLTGWNQDFEARQVLHRFLKLRSKKAPLIFDVLVEIYQTNKWNQTMIPRSRRWRKNPSSPLEFVMFYGFKNKDQGLRKRLADFFDWLALNRVQLKPFMDLRDLDITTNILNSIDKYSKPKEYGQAYGLDCVKLALQSPSEQIQIRAVQMLGRLSSDHEDSRVLMDLLANRDTKKKNVLVKAIRQAFVSMGPSAIYSLYRLGKRGDSGKPSWLDMQIALIACEMTLVLPPYEPSKETEKSMFEETKFLNDVLRKVIFQGIGLDPYGELGYDLLFGEDKLKSEIEKSHILPQALKILSKTRSSIMQKEMHEYAYRYVWSFMDVIRPRIERIPNSSYSLIHGYFNNMEEYEKYLKTYLKDIRYWKPIIRYLVSIDDETGIQIANEIAKTNLHL